MFKTLSAPLAVQWEVTERCIKNCIHCYNYWRDGPAAARGWEPIVPATCEEIVTEIIANRVLSVTITGGEPLLVLDEISAQIARLTAADIEVSLNSTLATLGRGTASRLQELGIRSILVSVPSCDPDTDHQITNSRTSWHQTQKGIRIAVESGFQVTANMVVSKRNLHQIYTTAQYVQSLGVRKFAATKVSKPANCSDFSSELLSRNEFKRMVQELLRVQNELGLAADSIEAYPTCAMNLAEREQIAGLNRLCTAGKVFCMIGVDGRVRPCPLVCDFYGAIGDHGGLKAAWLAMQPWRSGEMLPSECAQCPMRATCGGGCKAEARHTSGSYSNVDPYCDLSSQPVRVSRRHSAQAPSWFRFNSRLKCREEAFGGILFLSSSKWLGVGPTLFGLTTGSTPRTFTLSSFGEALGVPPERAWPTAEALLGKGILVGLEL